MLLQNSFFVLNSGSRIDGILESLGIFVPKIAEWFPNAVRHTYRIEGMAKIQDYIRGLIAEHRETLVKGQPRDLTDAYLELSEATTEADSSFHPNGIRIKIWAPRKPI